LLRVPVEATEELAASLQALRAFRSARKESEAVTVRIDPTEGF
jgi:primosomal protein N' (replication factor Y)